MACLLIATAAAAIRGQVQFEWKFCANEIQHTWISWSSRIARPVSLWSAGHCGPTRQIVAQLVAPRSGSRTLLTFSLIRLTGALGPLRTSTTDLGFCWCVLDCGHSRRLRKPTKVNSHKVDIRDLRHRCEISCAFSENQEVLEKNGRSLRRDREANRNRSGHSNFSMITFQDLDKTSER